MEMFIQHCSFMLCWFAVYQTHIVCVCITASLGCHLKIEFNGGRMSHLSRPLQPWTTWYKAVLLCMMHWDLVIMSRALVLAWVLVDGLLLLCRNHTFVCIWIPALHVHYKLYTFVCVILSQSQILHYLCCVWPTYTCSVCRLSAVYISSNIPTLYYNYTHTWAMLYLALQLTALGPSGIFTHDSMACGVVYLSVSCTLWVP